MRRAGNTRSTLDSIASPSWELSHNHTHTEQVSHVLDECSIRGLNDVYVPASGAVIHRQEVPVRMMEGGVVLITLSVLHLSKSWLPNPIK